MALNRVGTVNAPLLLLARAGCLCAFVCVAAGAQAPAKVANEQGLRTAADVGTPAAQLAYAEALARTSPAEATRWAQKAAAQGLGAAWYWLAEHVAW